MNKRTIKNKRRIFRIVCYVLLVSLTVLALVFFMVGMKREVRKNNQAYIDGATENLTSTVDGEFKNKSNMAKSFADSVTRFLSDKSAYGKAMTHVAYISALADMGVFDYIATIHGTTAGGYLLYGSWMDREPTAADRSDFPPFDVVRQQEYYLRAMGWTPAWNGGALRVGYYGVQFLEIKDHEPVFIFYAPVAGSNSTVIKDARDLTPLLNSAKTAAGGFSEEPPAPPLTLDAVAVTDPCAVQLCVMNVSSMTQVLKASFFGEDNRVLLAQRDTGKILATSTGKKAKDNFRDMILINNSESEADRIMAQLNGIRPGATEKFEYNSIESGELTNCTITALSNATEKPWALIQVFPSVAVTKMMGSLFGRSVVLIVEVVVICAIALALIAWATFERRKQIKYSNERMSLLLSQIPGLLIEWIPGNPTIRLEGNSLNDYELPQGNIPQGDFYSAVYMDDRVRLTDAYDRVLRDMKPVIIDVRVKRKDGDFSWMTLTLRRTRNASGASEIVGTATNIDRQKREVHEKEHIISAMSYAYKRMGYMDFDTNTYTWLQRDELTDGMPEHGDFDLMLKQIVEVGVAESDRDMLHAFIKNARANMTKDGQFDEIEYRLNGGKWERTTFIVISTADKKVTAGLLAAQDITEQKRMEQRTREALQEACETAQNASEAKTSFLSRMSHDVRTPMNAILGMTFLARQRIGDADYVQGCLDKIMVAGNRLLTLLNEVLDISRIESQSTMLEPESTTISAQMEELSVLSRTLAGSHHHRLTINAAGVRHDRVRCDSGRLQQILLNFISNAVKYTPDGGEIKFGVCELRADDDQAVYSFSVQDNGVGMTKEQIAHVYEPFYRADDSRVSRIEGTGLGMSIALNLARLMNGDIDIRSKPGEGTTVNFVVSFELDHAARKEPSGEKKPKRKAHADLSEKRVLVVEDNEMNREIAKELISMTGAAVETVADGLDAVEAVASQPPYYYDMIFMDIQMPRCNGYEATERIRALPREDVLLLPIVAMTANAFTTDVADAKRAGMDAHVSKPIDPDQIRNVMERYCR